MKRIIFILLMALLPSAPLLAQYSPCYNAAMAEGKRLYDKGNYSMAKKYFNEAKECPDSNEKEASSWVQKCNKAQANAAKASFCSVIPAKMSVVYAGINNPIIVSCDSDFTATATGATLTKTGDGTYNLLPDGSQRIVTVKVNSHGSNVGNVSFRVKDLPMPTALIRNVGYDGRVTKSALLAANGLELELKDFDFEGVRYDVVGYTMTYKTKAGTTKEAKATDSRFTEEMINAIMSANVGDVFVFYGIQARGNDGKVKTLSMSVFAQIN